MPMPSYPVLCYAAGCSHPAAFKIAARWSDGVQSELKTYGLCCEACLPTWFRRAVDKQRVCRLTPGETIETPGIYQVERGLKDQQLHRLEDRERELSTAASA